MYQLSVYRQFPDGTYDMATENAVRELQSLAGQDNDGMVTQATWQAIVDLEQRYDVQYQYISPYDALDQLRYDLEHPATATGNFPAGDPSLSEDGQWRWDGNAWQPAHAGGAGGGDGYAGTVSEDGHWHWDGYQWNATGASGSDATAGAQHDGHAGTLSDDGYWRWDGYQWQVA
jgi:hypothetical protein